MLGNSPEIGKPPRLGQRSGVSLALSPLGLPRPSEVANLDPESATMFDGLSAASLVFLEYRRWAMLGRFATITLAVAVFTAVSAGAAVAAGTPTETDFSFTFSAVMTGYCAFPVNVDTVDNGTRVDFVDSSGAITRSYIHVTSVDTFTANGKTLTTFPYTFNVQVSYDSSGNATLIASGIIERILLPDGSLFVSAGRADFTAHADVGHQLSPDEGNPGDVAAFCAALVP